MDNILEDMYKTGGIKGAPVYTLDECIACLPDDMKWIDDEGEEIADPSSAFKARFEIAVYLCDERMHSFLRLIIELTERKLPCPEDIEDILSFNFFLYDFIYLFREESDYYLILPVELIDIYRRITKDANYAAVNAQSLELEAYAIALAELYGAYEVRQFVAVWNQHHRDKITKKDAQTFLNNLMHLGADLYDVDGEYVVHECMDEDEFDELWEETQGLAYYMPSKSLIRDFAAKGKGKAIEFAGEAEMETFLRRYIADERTLEDLCYEMLHSCIRLESPQDVKAVLKDYDLPLKDSAFAEAFERLYGSLRSNIPAWELRGFTPSQYQSETGRAVPHFRLPGKRR